MFATILVPLDGQTPAETAVPYAVAQARAHQARLILMHVVARPEPCGPAGQRGGPVPRQPDWCADQLENATAEARAYLSDVVARHALPSTTTLHVATGDPAARIRDKAAQHPNCLLVMTTGDLAARETELSASLRSTSSRARLSNVFLRLSAGGHAPILSVNPAARLADASPAVAPATTPRPPSDAPAAPANRL